MDLENMMKQVTLLCRYCRTSKFEENNKHEAKELSIEVYPFKVINILKKEIH